MDGYKIAADAVVFTIEDFGTLSDDSDDYGVLSAEKLYGVKDVVATYYVKEGLIKLVVMESSASSDDNVFGVYDSYKAEIAADPGYEVRFLVDGTAVTYGSNSSEYGSVATATGLYIIKFDTNGDVKELSAATGATDVSSITFTSAAGVTGVSITISNNVATVDAGGVATTGALYASDTDKISLASDVVVYKLNSSSKWVKGSVSDLRMDKADKTVTFFDTTGKDKVADVVLVQ
jgi:hypothetical protein